MEPQPGIDLAYHLGRALQLTNILRDLDEDAAIGRLYLSSDALASRPAVSDPAAVIADPRVDVAARQIAPRPAATTRPRPGAALGKGQLRAPADARRLWPDPSKRCRPRAGSTPRRVSLSRLQKLWVHGRYGLCRDRDGACGGGGPGRPVGWTILRSAASVVGAVRGRRPRPAGAAAPISIRHDHRQRQSLVLSGNRAVQAYLARIGASAGWPVPIRTCSLLDLRDGARWRMRPSDGRIPWWIFQKDRRVPARARRLRGPGRLHGPPSRQAQDR